MTETVASIATAALRAYASGDLKTFMTYIAEDIEYALHLDQSVLPFAGETRGKDAFRQRIAQMHDAFDYVLFRPFIVRAVGNIAHNQVEFLYRHKATGEMLSGRARFVSTIDGAQVRRIEEYHDAERIKAFVRLVGGVAPPG